MAVAIPTPTAVNARIIMVQEMTNGGRSKPMCDHLLRELSASVNSQKKGCYVAHQTMAVMITSRQINNKCAKQCMTTVTGSYQPASSPQKRVVTQPAKQWQQRSQVVLSVSGAIGWNSKTSFKDAEFQSLPQIGEFILPLLVPDEPTGTAKSP